MDWETLRKIANREMLKQSASHTQQSTDQEPPRSRFWLGLTAWVAVIVLIVFIGGALRNVLESPASTSPSSDPPATIYITLPPTGDASMDLPPIQPVPVSTVVPAGARAPHAQPPAHTRAVDLLARLPIKPAASNAGYQRSKFGPAWPDVDHNGCDTRNDILRRDLQHLGFAAGEPKCVVESGELLDPYSTNKINFKSSLPSSVQIDQVVSLADAWQKGAQGLSPAQRIAFANDPLNLIAVESMTIISKDSKDASSWLPSNDAYRCSYAARQISVKATYDLWLSKIEHDVLAAVLSNCPEVLVPTDQHSTASFFPGWPVQKYPITQAKPTQSVAPKLPADPSLPIAEPSSPMQPTVPADPQKTAPVTPTALPSASSDPSVSTLVTPRCRVWPTGTGSPTPLPSNCPSSSTEPPSQTPTPSPKPSTDSPSTEPTSPEGSATPANPTPSASASPSPTPSPVITLTP
ncbi:HNH endonuclease family protein [Psychromicrobium lacuslunae]|uniref:HNH endonuclease family protein n=1 Tax=Psychromicrobium lacuslunae TaxID=1618207 RepID=UPI0006977B69|nr:HNH endonuclease family protein [Psychromicrobium lacuslunae]